jgi:hypothetical protein
MGRRVLGFWKASIHVHVSNKLKLLAGRKPGKKAKCTKQAHAEPLHTTSSYLMLQLYYICDHLSAPLMDTSIEHLHARLTS